MKSVLVRNNRRVLAGLLVCTGFICNYPSSAFAESDNSSVQITTQSTTPQKRTLVGTVVDSSTGETLIGVNVKVQGEDGGTITDIDGKFQISVTSKTELIFSYIGYKTQTLMVGDLGVMTVKLASDNEMLDEVVIVGQGTQKKVSVTGAIATVKGATLKAPSSSLTSSLAGKLAGVVSMVNSGEPGSTSEFYIRGINTFGGVATPLILLDGIEISSADLNRIPAESIESFSLLKDASATAIYGNRGANGVMLVTTKKGQENTKATINVSLEASYFRPINVPKFADGATYMRAYNEAEQARSLTPITSPKYSEDQILNTELGTNPYVYPDVDWFDQIFRSGNYNQRANVNVSGGGSRVTYYMSLQANHDTGLLDAPDYFYNPNINQWQYNFQNNISYKLTNTTTIDLRMMAQIGNMQGPNYNIGNDLYKRVMRTNPVEFPAYFPQQDGDDGFIRFGGAEIKPGVLGTNPYEYMMSSFKEVNFNTLNTSLALNQDLSVITKGLSLKALVNFKNWSETSYTRSIKSNIYKVKDGSYNPETGEYDYQLLQTGDQFLSQSGISRNSDQTFYFDARLDWKRSFGDHNLTAMAMYMMREYRSDVLPNRNQGYSGRVTYDYASKYLVEFNFGYNGSERFHKSKRFGFFPSAGLAWVVSNESFWDPFKDVVSKLKLRASYGIVGNDAIGSGRFLYLSDINMNDSKYGANFGYNYDYHRDGISVKRYSDPEITWEKSAKTNFALEFTLFNDLNVTTEYYTERRKSILQQRTSIPASMGLWVQPYANLGEAKGHGVDLSLDYNKYFANKSWLQLRGNFTYATSEYMVYEDYEYPGAWWKQKVGYPTNQTWGYIAEGLFVDDNEVANSPVQFGEYGAGDIKYRDVNKDGKITDLDQVPIGYPKEPEIVYGFGASYGYKNWDISVFFQGLARESFWIDYNNVSPFFNTVDTKVVGNRVGHNALAKFIADSHWSEDNRDAYAVWPRLSPTSIENNSKTSTWFMRDGSFLRLKQLEIGYTIPEKVTNKVGIKNLRFYVTGNNLLCFSKFKLWDPEMAGSGLGYPVQRVYNIGLNLTF